MFLELKIAFLDYKLIYLGKKNTFLRLSLHFSSSMLVYFPEQDIDAVNVLILEGEASHDKRVNSTQRVLNAPPFQEKVYYGFIEPTSK